MHGIITAYLQAKENPMATSVIYTTSDFLIMDTEGNDDLLVINPERLDDYDYAIGLIGQVVDNASYNLKGPETFQIIADIATHFLNAHGESLTPFLYDVTA
jgi:hypothetical protein